MQGTNDSEDSSRSSDHQHLLEHLVFVLDYLRHAIGAKH